MIVDILNFDLKKKLKKIQPRSRNKFLKCLSQITLRFEFVPTYPTLPYTIIYKTTTTQATSLSLVSELE